MYPPKQRIRAIRKRDDGVHMGAFQQARTLLGKDDAEFNIKMKILK